MAKRMEECGTLGPRVPIVLGRRWNGVVDWLEKKESSFKSVMFSYHMTSTASVLSNTSIRASIGSWRAPPVAARHGVVTGKARQPEYNCR